MKLNKLKKQIKENLLTKSGRINPHINNAKWIKYNNFTSIILEINKIIPETFTLKEKIYIIILFDGKIKTCETCGNTTKFFNKTFNKHCSTGCSNKNKLKIEKIKKINLERYGNEEIREKIKKTNLERYGVEYPLQSEEIREKIKKTNLERYGVESVLSSSKIREKIHNSNLKKYGFKNNTQNHLNEYQKYILKNIEIPFNEHIDKKIPITTLSLKYGFGPSTLYNTLKRAGYNTKIFSGSEPERKLQDKLKKHNITYISNDRQVINPKEIDIFLPEYNLGIEINGLYWHSDDRKHKNHLLDKQILCNNKGIKLIHFFDTEILYKLDICESIILNIMGLNKLFYGRKTKIKELYSDEYRNFCLENHLQGPRNASIRYGLFFEDELVSCMSFNKTGEMVRFCNKKFTSVVGGASKLFKHIIKNHNLPKIYTFSDKRIFDGGLYEILGFKEIHDTSPNYFYFNKKEYVLRSRIQFQKHKLKDKLENFDINLSEIENMRNNDWLRIYDCGNTLWEYP